MLFAFISNNFTTVKSQVNFSGHHLAKWQALYFRSINGHNPYNLFVLQLTLRWGYFNHTLALGQVTNLFNKVILCIQGHAVMFVQVCANPSLVKRLWIFRNRRSDVITIDYRKNFTTKQLLTIEHMAMLVIKSIRIQIDGQCYGSIKRLTCWQMEAYLARTLAFSIMAW